MKERVEMAKAAPVKSGKKGPRSGWSRSDKGVGAREEPASRAVDV